MPADDKIHHARHEQLSHASAKETKHILHQAFQGAHTKVEERKDHIESDIAHQHKNLSGKDLEIAVSKELKQLEQKTALEQVTKDLHKKGLPKDLQVIGLDKKGNLLLTDHHERGKDHYMYVMAAEGDKAGKVITKVELGFDQNKNPVDRVVFKDSHDIESKPWPQSGVENHGRHWQVTGEPDHPDAIKMAENVPGAPGTTRAVNYVRHGDTMTATVSYHHGDKTVPAPQSTAADDAALAKQTFKITTNGKDVEVRQSGLGDDHEHVTIYGDKQVAKIEVAKDGGPEHTVTRKYDYEKDGTVQSTPKEMQILSESGYQTWDRSDKQFNGRAVYSLLDTDDFARSKFEATQQDWHRQSMIIQENGTSVTPLPEKLQVYDASVPVSSMETRGASWCIAGGDISSPKNICMTEDIGVGQKRMVSYQFNSETGLARAQVVYSPEQPLTDADKKIEAGEFAIKVDRIQNSISVHDLMVDGSTASKPVIYDANGTITAGDLTADKENQPPSDPPYKPYEL